MSVSSNSTVYDIGLYVGKQSDKFTKFNLITNHWKPPKDYEFPYSTHIKCGKEVKRYLGQNHLDSRHWLELSKARNGLYCKYCVLFAQEYSGHNKGVFLKSFVTKPVTSFAKLLGKDGLLQTHETNIYHQHSVEAGKYFVKSYLSPEQAVVNQVNTQRLQQIKENRDRLRPIIESIIFLGRQNIPFRGHRDDGSLLENKECPVNEGNFRELLRFRIASGDKTLKRHLENTSARATYIGKNTQNDLINCCGEEISCEIVRRVQKAGYYGILFDETTDLAHMQQLSLTLRYLHEGNIREDFIAFIDAHEALNKELEKTGTETDPNESIRLEPKLTGERLGKIVLSLINKLALDIKKCVGVGTDSCSVMASEIKGAVSEVLKEAVHAVRCPCLNHALNNSLSKSNNVQCARNSIGTIKSVVEFFSASAKRNSIIKDVFRERRKEDNTVKGTQLSGLCETRWVERHDSVMKFKSALPYIVESLEKISQWSDINSSSKANSLIKSLCDVQFICSLIALIDVLQQTLPLSRMLQAPKLDLMKATDVILDTISVLETKRKKCDVLFTQIFSEVQQICSDLDIDVKVPRITGRQINRSNYTAASPEEYYRKSIYIPLLDNVINDLKDRFPKETLKCFGLRLLIPSYLVKDASSLDKNKEDEENEDEANEVKQNKDEDDDPDEVSEDNEDRGNPVEDNQSEILLLVDRFSPILSLKTGSVSEVEAELNLWRAKWLREKSRNKKKTIPATALEALDECDEEIYPLLNQLLSIFATLPVSVASAERSFSSLRRLKSWMRTTMREDRLCGLCLLHSHREINIDIEKVIDRFANSGNRKLEFVI